MLGIRFAVCVRQLLSFAKPYIFILLEVSPIESYKIIIYRDSFKRLISPTNIFQYAIVKDRTYNRLSIVLHCLFMPYTHHHPICIFYSHSTNFSTTLD